MTIMQNLTEENVEAIEEFFKKHIEPENEFAEFHKFWENKKPDTAELEKRIDSLTNEVAELKQYIKSVFDSHVLIDGQFKKIRL